MRDPLAGFRVVDLTVDRGELCARLLGDLGAEVVKVEPPGGSTARGLAPLHEGVSLFFAARNAGKRSVVIDLPAEEEKLHALLACADAVILSDGSPGDLDPHALSERHPHLVVTAITPYGLTGPWKDRVATDGVLAATGSIAFKAGVPEKAPLFPPASFVDDCTCMPFAFGTLCALWQREETGYGQVLDCSAIEAIANQGVWTLHNTWSARQFGQDMPELRNGAGPVWPSFKCADGFVRVVMLAARQWVAMRAWLGEPEYLQDPELEGFVARIGLSETVINPLIAELFKDMTMDEISTGPSAAGSYVRPRHAGGRTQERAFPRARHAGRGRARRRSTGTDPGWVPRDRRRTAGAEGGTGGRRRHRGVFEPRRTAHGACAGPPPRFRSKGFASPTSVTAAWGWKSAGCSRSTARR